MPVEESSTGYEAENKGFKIKRGVIMYGKKLKVLKKVHQKNFYLLFITTQTYINRCKQLKFDTK